MTRVNAVTRKLAYCSRVDVEDRPRARGEPHVVLEEVRTRLFRADEHGAAKGKSLDLSISPLEREVLMRWNENENAVLVLGRDVADAHDRGDAEQSELVTEGVDEIPEEAILMLRDHERQFEHRTIVVLRPGRIEAERLV